jgi:hypothetical protein
MVKTGVNSMFNSKLNEAFIQQQIQRELEMERHRKKTQKKFNETKKANVELNEAIQDIQTLKIYWAVGGKKGRDKL